MNIFQRKAVLAAQLAPAPIPEPRILTDSPQDEKLVDSAVKLAVGQNAADEGLLDQPAPEILDSQDEQAQVERAKLESLVEDDFPFDPSQIEFIDGIIDHLTIRGGQGACGTGAAGTGKTTCTKKIIDRLMDSSNLSMVDMDTYWKSKPEEDESDGDHYEKISRYIPSIVAVSYTGRATQMVRKNFPVSWHGNIMTIHRMLAFMPVFDEYFDEESQTIRKKMHFEPQYTADNKMPWDFILIDEAGMLDTFLWEMVRVAMKPGCKVIMIGDINQLPPVHGRSIFGFAMSQWPSWELTHIHRQEGKDNPIVDNAWRVLNGQMPESSGTFQMTKIDGLVGKASQQIRKFLPLITEKGIYDPIRDTTITATNGEDAAGNPQRGYALGQIPLNQEFALVFNRDAERYIIDAGRKRQKFAVGDKVMATRNDYETGITNGMTGVIVGITENGAWGGDRRRFGTVKAVNDYMREENDSIDDVDLSLEDMMESYAAQDQGRKDAKESKDRGPASHIVTVQFGSGESGREIAFASLAEVGSLMTAYVVTCHKMQGGESPVVVIILHDAHKAMYYREWLYTAITRASQKCIILYTDLAIRVALNKQKIKGKTLAEKIRMFTALTAEGITGPAVRVNLAWGGQNLPAVQGTRELSDRAPEEVAETESKAESQTLDTKRIHAERIIEDEKPEPESKVIYRDRYVIIDRVEQPMPKPTVAETIDGGELKAERESIEVDMTESLTLANRGKYLTLPAPAAPPSMMGAYMTQRKIEDQFAQRLLLAPTPIDPFPDVDKPKPNPFVALFAKNRDPIKDAKLKAMNEANLQHARDKLERLSQPLMPIPQKLTLAQMIAKNKEDQGA